MALKQLKSYKPFSTYSVLKTNEMGKDSTTSQKFISHQMRKGFQNKLSDLNEEREGLEYDLSLVDKSIRAASKITDGQEPSNSENECFSELKENYAAFIESDSEDDNSTSLLNRIMKTKSYIKKELFSNKASISKLLSSVPKFSKKNELDDKGKKPIYDIGEKSISDNDKGKKPIYDIGEKSISDSGKVEEFSYKDKPWNINNIIEKGESSKRKRDTGIDEELSSKKSKQSTTEYIDDLPYNPFDDIGTD